MFKRDMQALSNVNAWNGNGKRYLKTERYRIIIKTLMVDRIGNSEKSRIFHSDWTNQIRGFLDKKASNDM
jgi:hypothetical protein